MEKLRQHVTLIPQDPELFNNTIGYNITMDLKVQKEDLDKVIAMAQLNKVIARLEKGLDTVPPIIFSPYLTFFISIGIPL